MNKLLAPLLRGSDESVDKDTLQQRALSRLSECDFAPSRGDAAAIFVACNTESEIIEDFEVDALVRAYQIQDAWEAVDRALQANEADQSRKHAREALSSIADREKLPGVLRGQLTVDGQLYRAAQNPIASAMITSDAVIPSKKLGNSGVGDVATVSPLPTSQLQRVHLGRQSSKTSGENQTDSANWSAAGWVAVFVVMALFRVAFRFSNSDSTQPTQPSYSERTTVTSERSNVSAANIIARAAEQTSVRSGSTLDESVIADRTNPLVGQEVLVTKESTKLIIFLRSERRSFEGRGRTVKRGEKLTIKGVSSDFFEVELGSPSRWIRSGDVVLLSEAVEHFTEMIEREPNSPELYALRAAAHENAERHQLAIDDYSVAIERAPNNVRYYDKRAAIFSSIGDYASAADDLGEAISISPNPGSYRCRRGYARLRLSQFEAALQDYDRSNLLGHRCYSGFYHRGRTKYALSDFEGAVSDFTLAMNYTDDDYYSLRQRGISKRKLGMYDEALADFSAALELRPNDASCLNYRLDVFFDVKDYDQIIKECTDALSVLGDDPVFFRRRGVAYLRAKDYEQALIDYSRAIELDPENAYLLNELAWLLATCSDESIHDGQRAVQLAERACEATTWENVGYVDTLAAAYARAGDFPKALRYQQQAVDAASDDLKQELIGRLRLYENNTPFTAGGKKQ